MDHEAAVSDPTVAFALQHVHNLICGSVPVFRINFPRKNMHKTKALFATWIQSIVSDPLDSTPFINNRLKGLRFSNDAL